MKRVSKMKIGVTLILWALCVLFSLTVMGFARASERCSSMSAFAASTMELRQMGAPMELVWDRTTIVELRPIVVMAYQRPQYQSGEYQRRAVQSFRNEVFLACVEGRL